MVFASLRLPPTQGITGNAEWFFKVIPFVIDAAFMPFIDIQDIRSEDESVWFLHRFPDTAQLTGFRMDAVLCNIVINGGVVLPFILR